MNSPKRRKEDGAVISYKTVAIGAVALIVSLVGYVHLSDIGGLHKKIDDYRNESKEERKEIKGELAEIRKDTSEIGVLSLEIEHLKRNDVRIEGEITDVKKKYELLDGKINIIFSRLAEDK